MSFLGSILLAIAIICVTAALFVGWVVLSIIRGVIRLFIPAVPPKLVRAMKNRINGNPAAIRCSRQTCQNFNPPGAQFCRCCGALLQTRPARLRDRRIGRVRMEA